MARADLHYAMAVDHEILEASSVDPGLLDPVVRVPSGVPGPARPFVVLRDYQGPVGDYTERFELRDAGGRVVHASPVQRIHLTGEMFEDRFTDVLRGIGIEDPDEHTLHFFIDDDPVGAVPVFVESGLGGDPRVAAEETFRKAVGKGEIVWITVPAAKGVRGAKPHTQPVWFLAQGGKLFVLTGPGEQDVQGLVQASEVEITARSKDLRSRVSRVPAAVRIVAKDDPEWDKLANAATPKRLNLPDKTFEAAITRWRETCELVELTPRFARGESAA
jgi:hypothetical protein